MQFCPMETLEHSSLVQYYYRSIHSAPTKNLDDLPISYCTFEHLLKARKRNGGNLDHGNDRQELVFVDEFADVDFWRIDALCMKCTNAIILAGDFYARSVPML